VQFLIFVIGSLITLFGCWSDVGVFFSGNGDLPISWESFIIPGGITALGVGLLLFGLMESNSKTSSADRINRPLH
jgi:hypothetical protein